MKKAWWRLSALDVYAILGRMVLIGWVMAGRVALSESPIRKSRPSLILS